ncbi:sugar MFS transporter [Pseudomonas sp. TE3610]
MHDILVKQPDLAVNKGDAHRLRLFALSLFFIFGGATSLNDVLIPKLKSLFSLSYSEAMLVQSSFFLAYFVASIPAGKLIGRIGYMRAAVVGLLTMATGCLMFIPAAKAGLFGAFLLALFVLAIGVTTIQVVSNPLISLLGSATTAHSRMTFAHGVNAVGTTLAPYLGAVLILGSLSEANPQFLSTGALKEYLAQEAQVISNTYTGIALALIAVAMVVWQQRGVLPVVTERVKGGRSHMLELLKRPRFAFGAICLFAYVGAEVAIGSILVSFLMLPTTLALDAAQAGKHIALYWGGAMLGRFIGAWLLRRFSPGKIICIAGTCVVLLIVLAAATTGMLAGWCLIAVGLFNSVMFPTIFALACEGLGKRSAEGSGVICCAIVGGAIVPLLTGVAADLTSLGTALFVPAICYVAIGAYGWCVRQPCPAVENEAARSL